MREAWRRMLERWGRRAPDGGEAGAGASEDLELVRQAHAEWLAAKAYFESVHDPELVDHAIALMTAAERRYAYLLRQARRSGLSDADLERVLGARLPPAAPEPAEPTAAGDAASDRDGVPAAVAGAVPGPRP